MAAHKRLGENLGALQLRCVFGWPKNAHAMGAECVHHTGSQGAFRSNNGQSNLFFLRPRPQRHNVRYGEVLQARVGSRAPIAWRHVNHLHLGRLRKLPRQSMLTATTTNH